jgi:hypothetical protein
MVLKEIDEKSAIPFRLSVSYRLELFVKIVLSAELGG